MIEYRSRKKEEDEHWGKEEEGPGLRLHVRGDEGGEDVKDQSTAPDEQKHHPQLWLGLVFKVDTLNFNLKMAEAQI